MAATQEFQDELHLLIQKHFTTEFSCTPASIITKTAEEGVRFMLGRFEDRRNEAVNANQGFRNINFLDLPAEIRNRIYQETIKTKCGKPVYVGLDEAVGLCTHKFCNLGVCLKDLRPRGHHLETREIKPPITQVCRQIRAETLQMYYHNTTFATILQPSRFGRRPMDTTLLVRLFKAWLKAAGPEALKTWTTPSAPRNMPAGLLVLYESFRRNGQWVKTTTLEDFEEVFKEAGLDVPAEGVVRIMDWEEYVKTLEA